MQIDGFGIAFVFKECITAKSKIVSVAAIGITAKGLPGPTGCGKRVVKFALPAPQAPHLAVIKTGTTKSDLHLSVGERSEHSGKPPL